MTLRQRVITSPSLALKETTYLAQTHSTSTCFDSNVVYSPRTATLGPWVTSPLFLARVHHVHHLGNTLSHERFPLHKDKSWSSMIWNPKDTRPCDPVLSSLLTTPFRRDYDHRQVLGSWRQRQNSPAADAGTASKSASARRAKYR